jgi:hypothetical protein
MVTGDGEQHTAVGDDKGPLRLPGGAPMLYPDFRYLLGQIGGHWIQGGSSSRARNAKFSELSDMGLDFILLTPRVAGIQEVPDLHILRAAVR